MTRHLIAYFIILVVVVAIAVVILRSRSSRHRGRHHERINLIDDESGS